MKTIDIKSVIIGILGSFLIFTLYAMQTQNQNMGDIIVDSITIEAKNSAPFKIKNKEGNKIAGIGVSEEGDGVIFIMDSEGNARVGMIAFKRGGMAVTYSGDDKEVVRISVSDNGEGTILLRGNDEKIRIELGSSPESSSGTIITYKRDEGQLVRIGATTNGEGLITTGKEGVDLVIIGTTEGGNGSVSVNGLAGNLLVNMNVNTAGHGLLQTYSSRGNELVRLSSVSGNEHGAIKTYNSNGNYLVSITSIYDNGFILLGNSHGKDIIKLLGNDKGDGLIGIMDRYGDPGWGQSGKQ